MKKLIVVPGPAPVIAPVAYHHAGLDCVYIPRHRDEGGGAYCQSGNFVPCTYGHDLFTSSSYTPLYAGTKITITTTKEIVL